MSKQKCLMIPNEEMPSSCWECPCLRHDSLDGVHMWQCNLTGKTFNDIAMVKLKGCPLQEVWLDPEDIAYGKYSH